MEGAQTHVLCEFRPPKCKTRRVVHFKWVELKTGKTSFSIVSPAESGPIGLKLCRDLLRGCTGHLRKFHEDPPSGSRFRAFCHFSLHFLTSPKKLRFFRQGFFGRRFYTTVVGPWGRRRGRFFRSPGDHRNVQKMKNLKSTVEYPRF